MKPAPWALAAALAVGATPALAEVDLGAGLVGVGGGNFLSKPSDKTLPYGNTGVRVETDFYPGFAGGTFGGGVAFDLRVLPWFGVEIDLLRTTDEGTGEYSLTVPGRTLKFDLTIGQDAWHLPVLAKLAVPSPVVSPVFLLGAERVFPGEATMKVENDLGVTIPQLSAEVDGYWMITGGAGVEIALPLPVLDLRIPFSLRASWNPGVSDELEERVETDVTVPDSPIVIRSEWEYQVVATLGVSAYF
ncbi:MAG: outer membrane beta-barrel protein [Polyangiaceae bacterium]|nr:outer membrane beta-barrel protein [Polyangiaceae bacterium]